MKLLSINVAMPQTVLIGGESVNTAIDKRPVTGPQHLGRLTIEGDGQADLSVHGGEYQAVYSYPHEHYAHWEKTMNLPTLEYGSMGENFTTTGLLETEVFVGDRFRIGGAVLEVTSPRLPCFKFAHKLNRPQILKPFLQSGFSGFYWRVVEEGFCTAGEDFELVSRSPAGVTMRALLGLMRLGEGDRELAERALTIECLPPAIREVLERRLAA